MLARLKNVGDAQRIFYDVNGTMQVVRVGESVTIDLQKSLVDRLELAQKQGDTIHVLEREAEDALDDDAMVRLPPNAGEETNAQTEGATGRVRIKKEAAPGKKKKEVADDLKPVDVLAKIDSGEVKEYHDILRLAKRALPDTELGPRPKKEQIVKLLRQHAANG